MNLRMMNQNWLGRVFFVACLLALTTNCNLYKKKNKLASKESHETQEGHALTDEGGHGGSHGESAEKGHGIEESHGKKGGDSHGEKKGHHEAAVSEHEDEGDSAEHGDEDEGDASEGHGKESKKHAKKMKADQEEGMNLKTNLWTDCQEDSPPFVLFDKRRRMMAFCDQGRVVPLPPPGPRGRFVPPGKRVKVPNAQGFECYQSSTADYICRPKLK